MNRFCLMVCSAFSQLLIPSLALTVIVSSAAMAGGCGDERGSVPAGELDGGAADGSLDGEPANADGASLANDAASVACQNLALPVMLTANAGDDFLGIDSSFAYMFRYHNDRGAGTFERYGFAAGVEMTIGHIDSNYAGAELADSFVLFPQAERLWRMASGGGSAEPLPIVLAPYADVTVAGPFVYIHEAASPPGTGSTLRRVPLSGGAGNVIASGTMPLGPLTISGDEVFWVNRPIGDQPGLMSAKVTGSSPVMLTDDRLVSVVKVQVDAREVFYVRNQDIRAVPRSGGASRIVAPSAGQVRALFVSNGIIYWSHGEPTAMVSEAVPSEGGTVRSLGAGEIMAVDECSLFIRAWSGDKLTRTLVRTPKPQL